MLVESLSHAEMIHFSIRGGEIGGTGEEVIKAEAMGTVEGKDSAVNFLRSDLEDVS